MRAEIAAQERIAAQAAAQAAAQQAAATKLKKL